MQQSRILDSWIVALAAVDFRRLGGARQFQRDMMARDLAKLWAGFSLPQAPPLIAAGNWGCGIFKGDAELKSVLQWIASGRAGMVMHYFPWDQPTVREGLPTLGSGLIERGATVGEAARMLFGRVKMSSTFAQMKLVFLP